eukprot:11178779-Lingulodinium_polyedra.AAC.1
MAQFLVAFEAVVVVGCVGRGTPWTTRPEAALSGHHARRCPVGGPRRRPGGGARWAQFFEQAAASAFGPEVPSVPTMRD